MLTKKIQKLDLLSYNVFHECDPNMDTYFQVTGIKNRTLGLGKHAFEIGISAPDDFYLKNTILSGLYLKEKSNVLFEVIDYGGNTIFSSLTTLKHVNGSSFGYIRIDSDQLDNKKYISNGPAKLVIVGQLEGHNLPNKWKNTYNVRKVIPFNIKKQHPNESFVLFEGQPNSTSSVSYDDISLYSTDANYRRFDTTRELRYRHLHYFDNLHTYGGKVDSIEIYKKAHSEAPSKQSWQFLEKIPISGSQELLTKTQFPLSSSFTDQTYEWIGQFKFTDEVTTWYYNGNSTFVSVDTNMLQGETSTYMVDFGAKSLRVRGDNSVHTPVIRKTVTDEQFDLKLLYSGSGAYAVLASKNKEHLTNPDLTTWTDNNNLGTKNGNHANTHFDVILHEKFTDFNPYNRVYPKIYGSFDKDSVGYYDKVKFTIPKDNYFVVRLMGASGGTSSFADVSVKHSIRVGENPPSWLHSSTPPKVTGDLDDIEYYYKFVNSLNDTSKDYTVFPVQDVDTKNTLVDYVPNSEILTRRAAHAAMKVRNSNTTSNGVNHAIYAVASPSGSYWSGFDPMTPGNTAGITAIGRSSDNNLTSSYGIVGVQALGQVTVDPESSDSRLLFTSGKYTWNTGSVWSATFGGDTGAGDAYFSQNVAIGSGFSWPTEHPSAALHIKGDSLIEGDVRIVGDMIAEQYVVSSSVTHMTQQFSSGSTIFGDSVLYPNTDTHVFSGSVTLGTGFNAVEKLDLNSSIMNDIRFRKSSDHEIGWGGNINTQAGYDLVIKGDTAYQGNPPGTDLDGGDVYIIPGARYSGGTGVASDGNLILASSGSVSRGQVTVRTKQPASNYEFTVEGTITGSNVLSRKFKAEGDSTLQGKPAFEIAGQAGTGSVYWTHPSATGIADQEFWFQKYGNPDGENTTLMYYTTVLGIPSSLTYKTEIIMSASKKLGFGGDSANNYIITNTDSPEDLEIHADQDILLTPDNNVGIGTTTPSKKLEVTGDISASGLLYASASVKTGLSNVVTYDTTTDQFHYTSSAAYLGGGGSSFSFTGDQFATDLKVGRDSDNHIDFTTDNVMIFKINNSNELRLNATSLRPNTNSGLALGSTTTSWSDLYLADGGFITFNNGDVVITQTGAEIELSGSGATRLNVAGDISGSSDLYIADDIFIGNRIQHLGDSNTYIDFVTDNISIVNEGANLISQDTDGLITIGTDAGNDNQLFISNEHNKTYISDGNKFGIGTAHPPKELTVNGDVSGSIGYLNTGHHGSQTRIKILPRDFHISDDTGRPLFIEEDVVGQLKMRVSNTSEIYASVEIPTGFKATHVMVYGSDASLTVSVVEGNINSASVTAKGSGNPNTEINITDVTATDTNFLWIGVSMANAFDYVYGGYVTIEKA